MPIPEGTYLPFSKLTIDLGHTSYIPQWSKTSTCDRIVNLIYDEAFVHATVEVQTQRLQALTKYCVFKKGLAQGWYPFANANERKILRDYTFNTALIEFNEGQIGRCGRFHRVLMAVLNETVGHDDKNLVYQTWLNNLILAFAEELNFNIAPLVAELTLYRIDAGPALVNTGETINLSAGQRIDMYTTGIGFISSQWELNIIPIGGEIEEVISIISVAIGDTGAYINHFTNAFDSTPAPVFNLVVT